MFAGAFAFSADKMASVPSVLPSSTKQMLSPAHLCTDSKICCCGNRFCSLKHGITRQTSVIVAKTTVCCKNHEHLEPRGDVRRGGSSDPPSSRLRSSVPMFEKASLQALPPARPDAVPP